MPLSTQSSSVRRHWECRSSIVDFTEGKGQVLEGGGWSEWGV